MTTQKTLTNPILRGFHPDPSIIRVGDDYFIATSTFEWFPGYQIYHSRDLINWELVNRPLNRVSQLDLLGVPDSCGVWAPCLSYHDETFYLTYSDVRSFDGIWKDTHNYVVMTNDIFGEWSEPVYLNSSGFDPSLFHDEDGRTWLNNMLLDHRNGKFFGGIVLQEYDRAQQKLIGDIYYLTEGTELGRTEGSHIFRRNGYYYLLLAEGGTGYDHAMTLMRSRNIIGPYELHPENPILTSSDNPEHPLQKTAHGDLVETQDGEWYSVFLASRPLQSVRRSILGRETAIEKMEWRDDDWLYLASEGHSARLEVEVPDFDEFKVTQQVDCIRFETPDIDQNFQALRVPMTPDWVNQTDRSGYLRLYGRESLSSTYRQSLIARRVQAHHTVTSTCIEFDPVTFQQMAGLVCYYNTYHYHYLHIMGHDDAQTKFLTIVTCDKYETIEPLDEPIDITGVDKVCLLADFNGASLQFYYGTESESWQPVGPVLDGSILSDEYVEDGAVRYRPCFTGAFVGLCCQDLSGRNRHADFEWFEYKEIDQ